MRLLWQTFRQKLVSDLESSLPWQWGESITELAADLGQYDDGEAGKPGIRPSAATKRRKKRKAKAQPKPAG
jgi:hypothetical protein